MFGKKQGKAEPAKEPAARAGTATKSAEELKTRAKAAKQASAAFSGIVTLLMRSPADRHHSLADLEWLVIPAIARGQYVLGEAQSKESGAVTAIGAVLWALVSEEVDKRLSDLSAPLRLKPNEWRSGDIPWIVLATGDRRLLPGLLQQLTKSTFKERKPKMRVRGKDGKISIGHLEFQERTAAPNA